MDIQTRKLQFIESILSIDNEKLIEKLETLLKLEQQKLDPKLKDKLTSRALKAEKDISEGRTMTREEMDDKLNVRFK